MEADEITFRCSYYHGGCVTFYLRILKTAFSDVGHELEFRPLILTTLHLEDGISERGTKGLKFR